MTYATAKMLMDVGGQPIPQFYDASADAYRPLSAAYPLPVGSGASGFAITQTTLAVTATSQTLIAANAARKYLAWMVVGTADVTISPATPAVVGVGMVYQSNGAGKQGGSEEFPAPPTNAFYAIAAATGSTVIVWEGV